MMKVSWGAVRDYLDHKPGCRDWSLDASSRCSCGLLELHRETECERPRSTKHKCGSCGFPVPCDDQPVQVESPAESGSPSVTTGGGETTPVPCGDCAQVRCKCNIDVARQEWLRRELTADDIVRFVGQSIMTIPSTHLENRSTERDSIDTSGYIAEVGERFVDQGIKVTPDEAPTYRNIDAVELSERYTQPTNKEAWGDLGQRQCSTDPDECEGCQ